MIANDRCPRCGAKRSAAASAGHCPRCLLRLALGSHHAAAVSERLEDTRAPAGLRHDRSEHALARDGSSHHSRDSGILAALEATVGRVPRVLLRDDSESATSPVRTHSNEMPTRTGEAGRYHLLGEIARGGMGVVLKGRDDDLGRDLAVKVLLEKHRDNPELVRRFVEEAQIGGQLQHPGIVPVYELGQLPDRRLYIAMKLRQGPHSGRSASRLAETRPKTGPRFLADLRAGLPDDGLCP